MKIISRSEAKSQKLKRYFTDVPCKHGHLCERVVVNYTCVQCDSDISKRHYNNHKSRVLEKSKVYYANNSDKVKSYQRTYNEINKNSINERHRLRYRTDPDYKMRFKLRGMLRKVLTVTNSSKLNSTHKILGYTPNDLKRHIESQFVEGMSWDNYGEWHIDHVVPIKVLVDHGVTDPSFINGLDNLQPLWAIDNLVKGDWSNL